MNDDDERRDIAERRAPFDSFGLSDIERVFRSMVRYPWDWARGFEEGFRTPLSEINTDEKTGTTTIILEMPGVDRSDIDISVTENDVVVKAESENRKYRRSYSFSRRFDPSKTKAAFNNGVLEVVLKPIEPKDALGYRVKVE
ncbi:MAG: Hsp20/alpha crystallin family protein [Candidatus Thorarchaeota archaeon]|nr:MAG: Hsp20/alpha crystallin family protein [Candidatus Thorarchaeota archaeon]